MPAKKTEKGERSDSCAEKKKSGGKLGTKGKKKIGSEKGTRTRKKRKEAGSTESVH